MKKGGGFGLVLDLAPPPASEAENERPERDTDIPPGLESAAALLRDALQNGSARDVAKAFARCCGCCESPGEYETDEE